MDVSTSQFARDAMRVGIAAKAFYSVSEIARITGWSVSTINRAIAKGDLRAALPGGVDQGKRCKPEWVDQWLGCDA